MLIKSTSLSINYEIGTYTKPGQLKECPSSTDLARQHGTQKAPSTQAYAEQVRSLVYEVGDASLSTLINIPLRFTQWPRPEVVVVRQAVNDEVGTIILRYLVL